MIWPPAIERGVPAGSFPRERLAINVASFSGAFASGDVAPDAKDERFHRDGPILRFHLIRYCSTASRLSHNRKSRKKFLKNVSTPDRLERATKRFEPMASAERRLLPALPGVPSAAIVAADRLDEASLGDPMHKLVLVAAGQLDVEGGTGGWLILSRHLIFIPADRAFRVRSASRTTLHVAHLDPAETTWAHHGCWTSLATPLAMEMIGQAVRWSPAEVQAGGVPRLFFRALAGLCPEWFCNPRMLWMPAATSDAMRDAVLYLRHRLDAAHLDGAAAAAGLSTRTFQRRCLAELGLSWRTLVREVRMMRSLELMSGPRTPVGSIARETGFASIGAFTTAFAGRFGMTPTDYMSRRHLDRRRGGTPFDGG